MSCYVHHMIRKGIFFELGIPASEENAEELAKKIADIVGMGGHNCSEIWARVNHWLETPKLKEEFRRKLLSSS